MNDQELTNALHGLFAYDTGCISSGIKDEILRKKVIVEILKDLGENQLYSARISRIARDMWLSEEAIQQGYGLEDMQSFIDWLDNEMRE